MLFKFLFYVVIIHLLYQYILSLCPRWKENLEALIRKHKMADMLSLSPTFRLEFLCWWKKGAAASCCSASSASLPSSLLGGRKELLHSLSTSAPTYVCSRFLSFLDTFFDICTILSNRLRFWSDGLGFHFNLVNYKEKSFLTNLW